VAKCQLLPPFVETFTFSTFVPALLAVPVMVYCRDASDLGAGKRRGNRGYRGAAQE